MKPGQDLDAVIAEKVMGCKVVEGRCGCDPVSTITPWGLTTITPWGLTMTCRPHEGWDGPFRNVNKVPPYSTSIAAAWEVVEKLASLVPTAYTFSIRTSLKSNYKVCIYYQASTTTGEWASNLDDIVRAPTLPHAICLAALRALKVIV